MCADVPTVSDRKKYAVYKEQACGYVCMPKD